MSRLDYAPEPSWGTPTKGIGTRTTAHLNRTRTLADALGIETEKVRLKAPDGRMLHRDCNRLTLVKADAWVGIPSEAESLMKRIGNGLVKVAA